MRVLVLSDIHANLEALTAVLHSADGRWDECWVLGDVAGYGPDFQACFECVRRLKPQLWLAGNHDLALLKIVSPKWFNEPARVAVQKQLDGCEPAYLEVFRESIELSGRGEIAGGVAVHASPSDPIFQYLITESDKLHALQQLPAGVRFFCYGHSHRQEAFCHHKNFSLAKMQPRGGSCPQEQLLIFNPGSVGQPRDCDPRACYGLFDPETLELHLERVSYPIEKVREKMMQQDLPAFLYQRLSVGR